MRSRCTTAPGIRSIAGPSELRHLLAELAISHWIFGTTVLSEINHLYLVTNKLCLQKIKDILVVWLFGKAIVCD